MKKIFILFLIGLMIIPLVIVNAVTYYGNFDNAVLLESSGIIRKWIVNNYTVIYNDELNYFYVSGGDPILSNQVGSESLWLTRMLFQNTDGSMNHDYSPAINMLGYLEVLSYQTVSPLYIMVAGNGYSLNTSTVYEWNHAIINTNATPIWGTGDPSHSSYLGFGTGGPSYFGNILQIDWVLFNNEEPDFNNYYEVWNGPTLVYQGLTNPDINDFITQTVDYGSNTLYISLICVGVILLGIISLWIPLTGLIGLIFGLIILIPQILSTTDNVFRSVMIVSLFSVVILFAIGFKRR